MKISAKTQRPEGGERILLWRLCMFVGLICFYFISVGLVPVINRYTCDAGKLNWLPSVPGAMAALKIYECPARLISQLPFGSAPFEVSANFWYGLANPPDTTP